MGLYLYDDLLHEFYQVENMIDREHGWNISFKPAILGLMLSLLLLVAMYHFVTRHGLSDLLLTLSVFAMAIVQALIQLFFFLHLGMESKPHWNSIAFLFTALVIMIIIGGSLWIMQNLNYNVMLPMHHEHP